MAEEKKEKKPKQKKSIKKDLKKANTEKKVNVESKKEEIKKEEPKVVEKKKKKTDYKTKDAIIIMVLSIIIGIGIGSVVTRLLCDKKHPKELKEYDEAYIDIVDNYYGIFNKKDLVYSSINGLLNGLNDRYAYLNTDQNAILNYEEGIEGYFNGLGVMISINAEGNIEISAVYEDSPAQKSGVLVGDVISTMEGKKYASYNYEDFSYNIKSSKVGTKLDFELLRNGETVEVTIETDKIELDSVYYSLVNKDDKKIAVFAINNFANNTYDQFIEKYEEAKKENIDGIIIDVRYNGEGTLDNAAKLASLFLDKDAVIYQKARQKENEKVINKNDKVIDLPVVIIADGSTISTAELFASALVENISAKLVGTNTFGKGYMQKVLKLSNGKYIQFTTEEWLTSRGNKVEGIGLYPNYEAKCDNECDVDVAYEKALEVIFN